MKGHIGIAISVLNSIHSRHKTSEISQNFQGVFNSAGSTAGSEQYLSAIVAMATLHRFWESLFSSIHSGHKYS